MRKTSDFVTPKIGARHFQQSSSAKKYFDREDGYRQRAEELVNYPQFYGPSQRYASNRYGSPQKVPPRYSHHQHTGIFGPDPPSAPPPEPYPPAPHPPQNSVSPVQPYEFQGEPRRWSSSPQITQPQLPQSNNHSFSSNEGHYFAGAERLPRRASFASENDENEKLKKFRKSQEQARYRDILEQQIREKKEREEKERRARELEDMKKEEEMQNYNPFGRGGGGAPLRKHEGKVFFAGAEVDDIPSQQGRFGGGHKQSRRRPNTLDAMGNHGAPSAGPSNYPQQSQTNRDSRFNTPHEPIHDPSRKQVNGNGAQAAPQPGSSRPDPSNSQHHSPPQQPPYPQPPPSYYGSPDANKSLDKMEQQFQDFRNDLKRYQDFNMMRAFEPFQGLGDAIRDLKTQLTNSNSSNGTGKGKQYGSDEGESYQLTMEIRHLENQMKELFGQIQKVQDHKKEQERENNDVLEEKQRKEIEKMYQGKIQHLEGLVHQVNSAADRIKEERAKEEREKQQREMERQREEREREEREREKERKAKEEKEKAEKAKEEQAKEEKQKILSTPSPTPSISEPSFPNSHQFNAWGEDSDLQNETSYFHKPRKKIRIYKDLDDDDDHDNQKESSTDSLFSALERKNKERMGYWDFIDKNLDEENDIDRLNEMYESRQKKSEPLERKSSEKELAGAKAWEYIDV
eukprot:gb/GECH01010642.1/.p1 GENE.gb/GECH01010642.1/~~gb/GECH01010642.1/.p1  ORF type:complete len:683 (+),score=203.64 gb/GECH01010642.1/:1-2049(+)